MILFTAFVTVRNIREHRSFEPRQKGDLTVNVLSLLTPKAQVGYLYDDYTIRQGLEKLRAHGYTAIPVLSREGGYVGTVSEGDFLWSILDREDNSLHAQEKQPIRDIIRKDFNPAVSIWVTTGDLLQRALRQSFIPVVDDRGAFVGIITRQAIMRQLTIPESEQNASPAGECSGVSSASL